MPKALKVAIGVVLALVVAVAAASAAIPDPDGYVYVCVNKSSGQVLVRDKGATCKTGYTPTRWVANQNAIPTVTTYRAAHSFDVPPGGHFGDVANCNSGDVATGGGFTGPGSGIGYASESAPNGPTPDAWFVDFVNTSNSFAIQAVVFAVCQHVE